MRTLIALLFFALPVLALPVVAAEPSQLTTAARTQVGVTTIYDPGYVRLAFPGGDIARDRGVCTDVVIRALRDGWGIDLQLAVNRDMTSAFSAYPDLWGLASPDRNIDHRRVPNLQTLFTRVGAALPVTDDPTPYLPGDIVTWSLPGNLAHIGIVSDQMSTDRSHPLILHNIGAGAREEDILFAFPITGHYRIDVAAAVRLAVLGR
ncbi:DUF1287 domain-containing protein [Tabrizicola sp.]|uniref:DUF1287 domain-containing protein n=1 Tax=Tabrizicola sp. TaxID=2005166 RepID=UPI00286A5EA0|nr:DUF1287 domain-containing protein [Tabrizicola sp.]